MSHDEAIREYAEYFVKLELERHSQEKINKLLLENPKAIDEYRNGWIESGRELCEQILTKHDTFLKRFRQGMLRPDNKASRRLFSAVTGVSLPSTVGGTDATVSAWLGDALTDYDRRMAEQRAAEKAAKDAKEAEKQAQAKAKADEEMRQYEEKLLQGERIPGSMVEDLCRKHGIEMHLRTIGCLRSRITSMQMTDSNGSVRVALYRTKGGSRKIPDGAVSLFRELHSVVKQLRQPTPTADQQQLNHLFGVTEQQPTT